MINPQMDIQDKSNMLLQTKIKPYKTFVKNMFDLNSINNNRIIDQALIIYFPSPNSYTGEDIIEFHVHGSRAVQKKLLNELSSIQNFRMADPGEFTQRALLNNKMDLYDVEALSDLLNSETEYQRQLATTQFLGKNKEIFDSWKQRLVRCIAHLEAFIDFEEVESDIAQDILQKAVPVIIEINEEIKQALEYQNYGEIIKEGLQLTILGSPNVGKSTLLNLLSKREVAITSDIPGTTRDIVTTTLNIAGNYVKLFDTAGIRATTDKLEEEGIKRALNQATNSDIILYIFDADQLQVNSYDSNLINFVVKQDNLQITDQKQLEYLNNQTKNGKIIYIINKFDQLKLPQQIQKQFEENNNLNTFNDNKSIINININENQNINVDLLISCKTTLNIDKLMKLISNRVNQFTLGLDTQSQQNWQLFTLIGNQRQREEIQQVNYCLDSFINQVQQNNYDVVLLGEDLRLALYHIGKIQGRVDNEQILDVLFKEFCIGK